MRGHENDISLIDQRDRCFAAGSRMRLRRLARDPSALLLVRAVATVREVEVESLLQMSRGGLHVARSRQLAMYLVHVLLGHPQDVVGLLFGRDRTTVSHACHLIEDRRDDPAVELEIAAIERRFYRKFGAGRVGALKNAA